MLQLACLLLNYIFLEKVCVSIILFIFIAATTWHRTGSLLKIWSYIWVSYSYYSSSNCKTAQITHMFKYFNNVLIFVKWSSMSIVRICNSSIYIFAYLLFWSNNFLQVFRIKSNWCSLTWLPFKNAAQNCCSNNSTIDNIKNN